MYLIISILIIVILFFIFTHTNERKMARKIKRVLSFEEVYYREKFAEAVDEHEVPHCKKTVVKTSYIKSKYAGEEMKYVVIAPKELVEGKSYPLIMFLHGIRDEADDWLSRGRIVENYEATLATNKIEEMILLIPESGHRGESWYGDFVKNREKRYESYLVKELIPKMKLEYSIGKVGIAGFSMGGHGAFKVALRNLDIFTVAGSFAGAISLIRLSVNRRVMRLINLMYIPAFAFHSKDKKTFLDVFGSFGYQIVRQDPYTLIKKLCIDNESCLLGKHFYLSVGEEDRKPYLMLQQWIDVVGRLKKYGVDFHASLYRGEAHTWDYVSKDLPNLLEYFYKKLK